MKQFSQAEMERQLAALIGPVGEPVSMAVEFGAVRRMAVAVDDFDPIRYDEVAARKRRDRRLHP